MWCCIVLWGVVRTKLRGAVVTPGGNCVVLCVVKVSQCLCAICVAFGGILCVVV